MRYLIKERLFSLGNKFRIEALDHGEDYYVEGRALAFRDKLKVYNSRGEKLIYIEQKFFRILPKYNFYKGRKKIASLKKELTVFRHRFKIKSIYGDLKIEGDITSHEFRILKGRKTVARVSKKWLSLSDSYEIRIDDEMDQALILSLVIVIDQILYDQRKETSYDD